MAYTHVNGGEGLTAAILAHASFFCFENARYRVANLASLQLSCNANFSMRSFAFLRPSHQHTIPKSRTHPQKERSQTRTYHLAPPPRPPPSPAHSTPAAPPPAPPYSSHRSQSPSPAPPHAPCTSPHTTCSQTSAAPSHGPQPGSGAPPCSRTPSPRA